MSGSRKKLVPSSDEDEEVDQLASSPEKASSNKLTLEHLEQSKSNGKKKSTTLKPQKFFSDPKLNRKVQEQAKASSRPRPVVKKVPTAAAAASSSSPQKRRRIDPDSLFNNFSNKQDKVKGKGKAKETVTDSAGSSSSEVEVIDGHIRKKKKKIQAKPVAKKGEGVKRRAIRPPSDSEEDSDDDEGKVDLKAKGKAKGGVDTGRAKKEKKAVGGDSKKGKGKAKAQDSTDEVEDSDVEAEPLASSLEEELKKKKEKVVKVDKKGKGREVPEKDKWDGKKPVQAQLSLQVKPKPSASTSTSKSTKPLASTSTKASSSSKAQKPPTTPRPPSPRRYIDQLPSSPTSSVHTSDSSLDLAELPKGIRNFNRASPGTQAQYIRQMEKDLERDTLLYEKRAKREKEKKAREEREEEARKRLEENARRIQEEARNRPSSSPLKIGQLSIGTAGGEEGMVGMMEDGLSPAQIETLAALQDSLNEGFDNSRVGGSASTSDGRYGGASFNRGGGCDISQGGGGALAGPSRTKQWTCNLCTFDNQLRSEVCEVCLKGSRENTLGWTVPDK